jgi:hypothetical protein
MLSAARMPVLSARCALLADLIGVQIHCLWTSATCAHLALYLALYLRVLALHNVRPAKTFLEVLSGQIRHLYSPATMMGTQG